MNDRKLILDVDTGIDDALALAYLATFDDVNLLGVVGTYGNVAMGKAVRNTQYVLERLGLRHIPVMRGSSHPSWAASFIPDAGCAQFHGTDGLGGFGPDASALAGMSDSGETDIPATSAPTCVSDSAESDMCRLISVGGYDVHDPHANPAADSFSLTFSSPGAANVPCSPVLSEGYGSYRSTGHRRQTATGDDGRHTHPGRQLLGSDRRNEHHPRSRSSGPCVPFRRGYHHDRFGCNAPVSAGRHGHSTLEGDCRSAGACQAGSIGVLGRRCMLTSLIRPRHAAIPCRYR